jgi:NADH-quinone oxidoreductase subunit F
MKRARKYKQYIFVCHGKNCLKCGAKQLQKRLEVEKKTAAEKLNYELIKTKCMDHCKDGPSMVIDNTWYGKVTLKDIDILLTKKAAK